MNKAKQDLFKFLNSYDENKIIDKIKLYNVDTITLEMLKKTNNKEYIKTIQKIIMQKRKNKIFFNEIQKLLERINSYNIKLIFLKGLFLAADLYMPKDIRQYGDIDVLINIKDLYISKIIFKELGYDLEYEDDIVENHLVFKKEVYFNNKLINIIIELHASLMPISTYKKINTIDIMNRAKKKKIIGCTPWLLEVNDNLLFLMIHLSKHYIAVLNPFIEVKALNISKIHDIVLLIDKYNEEINWDIIFNRAESYNVCWEVYLISKIINYIYPNRVPKQLIDRIKDSKFINSINDFFVINFHDFNITYLTADELINYSFFDNILREIISNTNNSTLLCPYNQKRYADLNNKFTIFPNKHDKITYNADTYAYGEVWSNNTYFYLNIRVYDELLIINKNKVDVWDQDSIDILFQMPERQKTCLLKQYTIRPVHENNEYKLGICYINKNKYLDEKLFEYTYDIYADGYNLLIGIPWRILKIVPYKGLKIGFNIAINDTDDYESLKRKSHLQWTGDNENWFDLRKIGKLIIH